MTAYGCQPGAGSENYLGWSWVEAMAARPEVALTVVTAERNAAAIEAGPSIDCRFVYVSDEVRVPEILPGQLDEVVRYLAFVRRAQAVVGDLGETFDLAHHVSWTNIRTTSPAFAADCPVVFGPVGGGQRFPRRFLSRLRPVDAVLELVRNMQVSGSMLSRTTRRQVSAASLVLASNQETAAFARRLGALDVELMSTCPSLGPQTTARKRTPTERFELIWVGRLLPRKGLSLAIDAVTMAAASVDVRLTVVGDGDDRDLLVDLPQGNFRVLGHVQRAELDDLYRTSHGLLYTSLRDSGGPPLAEAMSFGLPAITIEHQGPALLGQGWSVGVAPTTPEETTRSLAEAIVELARDGVLYDRLSKHALEQSGRASAESRALLALDWYSNAISQSPPGSSS